MYFFTTGRLMWSSGSFHILLLSSDVLRSKVITERYWHTNLDLFLFALLLNQTDNETVQVENKKMNEKKMSKLGVKTGILHIL